MAWDVTRWAWRICGLRPAHKFVLMALSDCADNLGIAFPSQAELMARTGHDRKTIQQALNTLIDTGLLEDTGRRCGGAGKHHKPGRVIVYRVLYEPTPLNDKPKNGPITIGPKTDTSQNGPTDIGPKTDLSAVDKSADDGQKAGTIGPKTDLLPPLPDDNDADTPSKIGPFFPCDRPENGPIDRPENGLRNLSGVLPVNPSQTPLLTAREDAKVSQKPKGAPGSRVAKAAERKAAVAAQRARDAESAAKFLEGLHAERAAAARKRERE